jgi:hypothetical protein
VGANDNCAEFFDVALTQLLPQKAEIALFVNPATRHLFPSKEKETTQILEKSGYGSQQNTLPTVNRYHVTGFVPCVKASVMAIAIGVLVFTAAIAGHHSSAARSLHRPRTGLAHRMTQPSFESLGGRNKHPLYWTTKETAAKCCGPPALSAALTDMV